VLLPYYHTKSPESFGADPVPVAPRTISAPLVFNCPVIVPPERFRYVVLIALPSESYVAFVAEVAEVALPKNDVAVICAGNVTFKSLSQEYI